MMLSRQTFLAIAAVVPILVGSLAMVAPKALLMTVKHAEVSASALVMARTVGVLLLPLGALLWLVRKAPPSTTLRHILFCNLLIQVLILPIDPIAYLNGTFRTLGSFAPNTLIHILLGGGFAYFWLAMKRELPAANGRSETQPG